MRPITLAILASCLIAVVIVGQVGAQFGGASVNPVPGTESPDCQEARVWHLQAAMRHSEAADQEYHLGAADAAYMLAEYGSGACSEWKQDASPPRYDYQAGEMVSGEEAVK